MSFNPKANDGLEAFLASADKRAFMVVAEASEVVGKGFKSWKEF